MTTMRAIRVSSFGGPEVLKLLADVPVPSVSNGQVLVKIGAAGINPVDTYIRSGGYARKPALPYTPGSDGAGVVHCVGDGVKQFKEGDRVYVCGSISGTYAEYTLCNSHNVYALPSHLSFSQGAAIYVPYYTAYRALIQRYGFHQKCLTPTAHFRIEAGLCFKDGTDGHGADVIIEMLANVSLAKDLQLVALKGRIGIVGNRGTIEMNPRETMAKESSIVGVMLGHATESERQEMAAAIGAGLQKGILNPVVGKEYELSKAPEAHKDIIENSGAKGKLVLVP
ncbi:PREDICTED: quinone oxidoreductase-like [Acropora digitifera]|uniref:quinone oxidoreductase-like n=1 Tax=Acropora digitifera TaxID=70779 RepID=UPI00077B003F|nr:PREDICTED: quinone oxidoreductase-like [Acropora digitifera]